MKRIICVLLTLVIFIMLSSCGNQDNVETLDANLTENTTFEQTKEKYDNLCVNITTKGGGDYATFSNVELDYYDGKLSCIYISNPTILSYKVSDTYNGGVCLISGAEIKDILSLLNDSKYIDDESIQKVLEIINSKGIFEYSPT